MSRTENAIKNAGFGLLCKMLIMAFSFVSRTAFIHVLGSTYLGINGLFTEVLSLLSFAELGFGSAMTFSMYKPVIDNDRERIIKLLNFYKKVYRIIAAVIASLGLCMVPFINYIVKGADWLSVSSLQLYFLIFLFNTVVGYFVTYKYTYINALQKNYITTNIDTVVTISSNIAQIIVIFVSKNFLLYLLVNSAILLVSRVFIAVYLNKKFPILKEKAPVPLSIEEKAPIFNEVKGLALHQFASAAVHSTDNLIISSMISVVTVGLISNYNMLINSVLGFVVILFNSVTAGFGNLAAESNTKNYLKVFKEVNFANFWIYGFCCVAFWILVPPFITLWIGADKLIDNISFSLIIINIYLQGQCTAYYNARIAKGNFNKDKWWAVAQAIVNLVVSVIGAKSFGLVGVYIGTIASRMIYVLFRPYSTYEFLFEDKVMTYYKRFSQYFIEVVLAALVTKLMTNIVLCEVTVASFVISLIIVLIVPNVVFFACNIKSQEFIMWKNRIKRMRIAE